jgi:flagellar biosynthesis protein FlhB
MIMACFLVPAGEAVVTTIITKVVKSNEEKNASDEGRVPFSKKLSWLNNLLWGGCLLLLFEHIWHGEIVPWFPFLTAAGDPAETSIMLNEMATVGGTMAVFITSVWVVMLLVSSALEKRAPKKQTATE